LSAKIYDYTKICNSILSVDPKIRFVGVINERGRLVAGGMKENVEPLENEKDDEMIFMELALRVKMRKEFDKQLGPVNFAMASLINHPYKSNFRIYRQDRITDFSIIINLGRQITIFS